MKAQGKALGENVAINNLALKGRAWDSKRANDQRALSGLPDDWCIITQGGAALALGYRGASLRDSGICGSQLRPEWHYEHLGPTPRGAHARLCGGIFFRPEGPRFESPGQRPGYVKRENPIALKGRALAALRAFFDQARPFRARW